ncbi:MAG: DUF63 family protein [Nanohaloarchaea archaeon]|nr:DUF63 family protein [Candidatus Nanohaloarchaea archaeon]
MSSLGGVKSFLIDKFWRPVANESVFYNPFNTAVYSALFALAAAYIGLPLLKKLDISIDRGFIIGITPYIFLGGALRSLKDINAVNTVLLETPFIYILMFGFTVSVLLISLGLQRKTGIDYFKPFSIVGIATLGFLLTFYSIANLGILLWTAGISLAWLLTGFILLERFKPELLKYGFVLPVAAHFFDATITAVGVGLDIAVEKHVLGRFFIDLIGPAGMFVMKGLIIIPAVLYIDRNIEGEERKYYLFLIALLGFAIATRNILTLTTA